MYNSTKKLGKNGIGRKMLLAIAFIFQSLLVLAQIPLLKSNANENEKTNSVIYKNLYGKYDFVVSCSRQSYWWSNRQFYDILAYGSNHWEKISISSKKRNNGKWTKPKIRTRSLDDDSAKKVIAIFNKNDFWNLSNDSLKINERPVDNNKTHKFEVDDGINYEFDVMTRNEFLIIEAYAPEYFFEKIPEIKSRERFIKCRDMFYSVYNSNGN